MSFIIKDNLNMDYDPDVEFPPVDDESSDDMMTTDDSSYDGDSEMSITI